MHKQSITVCIKLKMIISSPRFARNVNKVRKGRISMANAVAFVDRSLLRGYPRFLFGANSLRRNSRVARTTNERFVSDVKNRPRNAFAINFYSE